VIVLSFNVLFVNTTSCAMLQGKHATKIKSGKVHLFLCQFYVYTVQLGLSVKGFCDILDRVYNLRHYNILMCSFRRADRWSGWC